MLTLNELRPVKSLRQKRKRVGRGTGSGWGKTSGRGSNGAKSRSGATTKVYYEGGQTPITRRLPKRGFTNIFRVDYQIVNLGDVQKTKKEAKEIDVTWLHENGLIHSLKKPVKILGNGDFSKAICIKANAFSKTAREKIEKAKGKAEVVSCA
jgi:large subunit ribosomal protein L15